MNEYLKNVKFNPKKINKGVRSYLGNMRVVVLLIIALLVGGFLSYRSLPQTVAPEINLPMIVVSSSLPGATPEDIETLVTVPIEDALKSISNVDTVTSVSENSYMYSVLTFNRGVEQSRALNDTENVIRRISDLPEDATNPNIKAVDFEDYPIIRLALTMNDDEMNAENEENFLGYNQVTLNSHIQKLIDTLEAHSLIDRVITAGQPEQEVQIIISSEKMASLGLSAMTLQSAIKSAVSTLPSGTIENMQIARSLIIDTSIENVNDLRLLPISIESKQYTLGELAIITEHPVPGHTNAWLASGENLRSVVTLDIYRTSGTNLTEAAKVAEKIIDETIAETDNKLHKTVLMSIATDLTKQFNDLTRNLGITILLVFVTLMLFVGWRQALLAAFSIPLTYAVAFIAMSFAGITVNFLSLFSLLLSLGLLVDVTIVVVSAMSTYMRQGMVASYKTGLLVYRDFFIVLLITTLTTVWAFMPLLFSDGIMGEYLKPIPIIVSSTLLASVFVGIFIILPLMIWFFDFSIPKRVRILLVIISSLLISFLIIFIFKLPLPFVLIIGVLVILLGVSGKYILKSFNSTGTKKAILKNPPSDSHSLRSHPSRRKFLTSLKISPSRKTISSPRTHNTSTFKSVKTFIRVQKLEKYYRKILTAILNSKKARRKTITMVIIFFVFSFSLVASGLVKNEFFPGEDVAYFFISVELSEGTKSSITEETAKSLLPIFTKLEGVTDATMQVGFGVDNHGGISRTNSNIALLTILTPLKEDGGIGSQKVSETARNLPIMSEFTDGKISILEMTGGPPAGADVEVTFIGDEIITLRGLANALKNEIDGKLPIENINISPRLAAATVKFVPNDTLLASRGLTREMIASQLHLFASGFTLANDIEFKNLSIGETGLAKKRDIVLRFDKNVPDLEMLGRMMISTPNGNLPLESLGNLHLTQNISKIERKDFERTVTLTASLVGNANLVEVNKEIAEIIDNEITLPTGYSWITGGANKENNESVQSILQGMFIAFALIFLTLIIHLRSYRKAMIVLLTIPLAASGVFVIFAITGTPLSFPALIGVLALFGIVVNNAIIIISQINANKKVGMNYKQSIIEGASSRLEPILLSSSTTMIGLLPITLSTPVWQGLGGAIIAGLLFSGTIMLFFIPTVYYTIMGDEKIK